MTIDVFCHHISRPVGKFLDRVKFYGYPVQNADPEVRLGLMEKYGIDVQALSLTTPILLNFNTDKAAEICSMSNNDNYALCKAYPKRFVNICIISLLDMRKAMKELERSINELDCRGVTIASNQKGRGLDSPEYFPLYAKLVEHDLPIFIHPTHWKSYPLAGDENWMMTLFGWPFDTTQAVWRLIFGGVLDRYPSLKIVMHHCGGMFPYFAQRVEKSFTTDEKTDLRNKLPRHISEYWNNIYGDTALDGTAAAFPCGYAFFGPDRMMFGTDYPFGPEEGADFIRENLTGVKSMKIPAENMQKILGENARKLLKIK